VGISWLLCWRSSSHCYCDYFQWESWSKVSYVRYSRSFGTLSLLRKVKSGYPILNRASFGIFGAWWPTFNRAVMAIVWNGVNAVQGGQCIYVMLHALTPRIANIKNIMGTGSALDSGGMIGFGIFWILTCCFLVIPIPKVTEAQFPLKVSLLTLF
jgi:cytosine/uracil/thiamine/allantoin permease